MATPGDIIKYHTVEVIKFLLSIVPREELINIIKPVDQSNIVFNEMTPDEKLESIIESMMPNAERIHILVGAPDEPSVPQIALACTGLVIYGPEIVSELFFDEE